MKTMQKFGFAALIIILSFLLDNPIMDIMEYLKSDFLDIGLTWITQFSTVFVVFVVMSTVFFIQGRKKEHVVPLWASFLTVISLAFILKFLIARPRPNDLEMLFPFLGLIDYSMPSIHAAAAFSVLPILDRHFERIKGFWMMFASLVLISRVYIGAHYLSDVAVGALLGYGIGLFFLFLDEKSGTSLNVFEVKRKIFHVIGGFLLIFLIYFDILNAYWLLILILAALIVSLISRRHNIPIVSLVLEQIEREEHRNTFPAKGLIFFLGGALLSVVLFPKDIAIASLLVLTIGDSVAALVGMHFGSILHPFSYKKFLEGHAAGALSAFIVLFVLDIYKAIDVGMIGALLACIAAMFVEGIDFKLDTPFLDDNLTVPLTAGLVMWVVGLFI